MRVSVALAVGVLALSVGACGSDAAEVADVAPDVLPGLDVPGDADAGPLPDAAGGGLGIDYDALEPGATPRWDPAGSDWTAVPWPNDLRRQASGAPDLSRFPNPLDLDLLTGYLAFGEAELDGFGLNGAIYVQLDGVLDAETLPAPQVTQGDPKAVIQLVNATPASPRYGERMPLLFFFHGDTADPYYLPNTLALRPVFGFPLTEGETWCAVVTRGVTDAAGRHLQAAPGFAAALDTEPTLKPLRDWLPDSGLVREDLAVATCFTTQRATQGLREVRAFLHDQPAPQLTNLGYQGKANIFHEFQGQYAAPNFQAGVKPYDVEGGAIAVDAGGEPVIQFAESIHFLLMVPKAFPMPADGWPVVLYGHGTGGSHESCRQDPAPTLLKEGVAMICIDQPLHGERGDTSWGLPIELLSFNFLNPAAGRSNFRQAAIDIMNLARSVAGGAFDIPGGTTVLQDDVRFDPTEIHFFGHSHGGLSGALALGIEPLINSAVLSGAGGVLTETLLRRKDVVDFKSLIANAIGVKEANLNSFHPVLSVVQMLVDVTDPINYAPYWLDPPAGGTAKHVLITEGLSDQATPSVGTNAMAAAARVPIAAPVRLESIAHLLRQLPVENVPVGSNAQTPTAGRKTAVLAQWEGDHFVAFTNGEARAYWTSFFRNIRFGLAPVVGPLQ